MIIPLALPFTYKTDDNVFDDDLAFDFWQWKRLSIFVYLRACIWMKRYKKQKKKTQPSVCVFQQEEGYDGWASNEITRSK